MADLVRPSPNPSDAGTRGDDDRAALSRGPSMPAHLVLLGRTLTPTHRPGRQSGADRARARRGRVAERRVAACGRDGRPRPSCSAGLAAALLASLVWAARADAVHAGALSWVNADRPRLEAIVQREVAQRLSTMSDSELLDLLDAMLTADERGTARGLAGVLGGLAGQGGGSGPLEQLTRALVGARSAPPLASPAPEGGERVDMPPAPADNRVGGAAEATGRVPSRDASGGNSALAMPGVSPGTATPVPPPSGAAADAVAKDADGDEPGGLTFMDLVRRMREEQEGQGGAGGVGEGREREGKRASDARGGGGGVLGGALSAYRAANAWVAELEGGVWDTDAGASVARALRLFVQVSPGLVAAFLAYGVATAAEALSAIVRSRGTPPATSDDAGIGTGPDNAPAQAPPPPLPTREAVAPGLASAGEVEGPGGASARGAGGVLWVRDGDEATARGEGAEGTAGQRGGVLWVREEGEGLQGGAGVAPVGRDASAAAREGLGPGVGDRFAFRVPDDPWASSSETGMGSDGARLGAEGAGEVGGARSGAERGLGEAVEAEAGRGGRNDAARGGTGSAGANGYGRGGQAARRGSPGVEGLPPRLRRALLDNVE